MIIVSESAAALKRYLQQLPLKPGARQMALRMILAFLMHRGRMSCSQAAGGVAAEAVHRGELTRFLARKRWQQIDFNAPLRQALLRRESRRGTFLFLIDATLVSQAGKKAENTFSTGNRGRNPARGRRYQKKKIVYKQCHSFTFGLLITPSGIRIPQQIPHYTHEYCQAHGLVHRTTAEAAADMIRSLSLPPGADVIVIGDTAYDAEVVRAACAERGYTWIMPANPERRFAGPKGQRAKLHSRLQDWKRLSPQQIRLRASTGKYARQRRLSRWRVGPKQKPRVYYAHQEERDVHNVGCVRLVFSTMKPHLQKATPDDVKILMTNARLSTSEVLELYALRWQIELFFKELKSTFGFAQYRFRKFTAVQAWVELALSAVMFVEEQRARRLRDRRLSAATRRWWEGQRLHGLAAAFRQQCADHELEFLAQRLKTPGGIDRLQRLLRQAIPPEFRTAA
jgi:hypothetical protein